MIILAIDTVGAICYGMIIGRCAGAVPWHILWVPCGGHSICYGYIPVCLSEYRDKIKTYFFDMLHSMKMSHCENFITFAFFIIKQLLP